MVIFLTSCHAYTPVNSGTLVWQHKRVSQVCVLLALTSESCKLQASTTGVLHTLQFACTKFLTSSSMQCCRKIHVLHGSNAYLFIFLGIQCLPVTQEAMMSGNKTFMC